MKAKSMAECEKILRNTAEPMPHWRYKVVDGKRKMVKSYWRRELLRLAEAVASGKPCYPFFVLDGNAKLPFAVWSTLPVYTCPGMGECGKWCYSKRAWRMAGAFARQLQNTIFIRHKPAQVNNALLTLPHGLTVRLYVDGDFDSPQTFWKWMRILRVRPDLKVYGYSKAWDVIWENRDMVPPNYVLNLSSGGRPQKVTAEQMLALPFVRGWFKAVKIGNYRPGETGNHGFARYADPRYYEAVKMAAPGHMPCPGHCGDCHACGDLSQKLPIAIGIH